MSASILLLSLVASSFQGATFPGSVVGQVSVNGHVPSKCGVSVVAGISLAIRCSAPMFVVSKERATGLQRVTVRPQI